MSDRPRDDSLLDTPDPDGLLRQLANLAREERQEQETEENQRLRELSAGRLDADAEGALRAWASASDARARAVEAHRPLGPEQKIRMAALAAQEIGTAPETASIAGTERDGGRVIEGGHRWRPWRGAATAAALAAAMALAVISLLGPGELRPGAGAALPAYSLQVGGQVEAQRSGADPSDLASRSGEGSPEAPLRFVDGNRLRLLLTPATTVEGPLIARAFVVDGARASHPVHLPEPEISEEGSVRLVGVVGREIPLPPGESTLIVTLGHPESLPPADEIANRLGEAPDFHGGSWIAWQRRLSLEDGPRRHPE